MRRRGSAPWLTFPTQSRLNIAICQKDGDLWACCGNCFEVVGWRFRNGMTGGGYWSCIETCGTVYDNHLGSSTASVLRLREDGSTHHNLTVREWVAGWLGVEDRPSEFQVRVTPGT